MTYQNRMEGHIADVVNIPAGVKHWHGAAEDSWFQHLAMEVPGEGGRTERTKSGFSKRKAHFFI